MRNALKLAWWLLLLAFLQGAALIFDRSHHQDWGLIGLHLLKAVYLGFAAVLFLRYLSLRSQKGFESLVESYNRAAGKAIKAEESPKESWSKLAWNIILLALAGCDFLLVFRWGEAVFKTTVWLDLGIWILVLRWLVRVYWFKAKGTRERLKEGLDDARSRMKVTPDGEPAMEGKRIARTPFTVLAGLSLLGAVAVSVQRLDQVREVFRVEDLKQCMDGTMRAASARFYQEGRPGLGMDSLPCLRALRGKVDLTLELRGGGLFLRALESDTADYFGNAIRGDEALVLDGRGRYRRAWATAAGRLRR